MLQTNVTIPEWQRRDVELYLSTAARLGVLPPVGSFSPVGRATPDVSALAQGYQTLMNGKWSAIAGTSAAAPAFAGMVSLLNEARLQAKMPAMGLLNPFLYANPDAFTDVTVGTNAIGRGTGPLKVRQG